MRAQATVFIILGAVLLIVIGGAAYYVSLRDVKPIEGELPKVALAPAEAQPVVAFYQSCIRQVSRDALRAIGDHGGYTSDDGLRSNPFDPTGANNNAVQLFSNVKLSSAYWSYLKSSNKCEKEGSCVFDSKRPELNVGGKSIAAQLQDYVGANLKSCLRDYPLEGYEVKEKGKPKTDVRFTPKTVQFLVTQPLSIVKTGNYEVEQFFYEEQLNLMEIYNLATQLTNMEKQHNYLEKMTREIIDAYGGRERNRLPPVSDFQVGLSSSSFWTKIDSERILRDVLISQVPLMQADKTKNYQYIVAPSTVSDPELYELIYNRNFVVPLNKSFPELTVNYVYLDWKPYFDINCAGQVCRPEGLVSNFLPVPFGFYRTRFAYDVSYPVLAEITNPDAFNGEGYSFKFFLEVNLRNNRPLTPEYTELSAPKLAEESEYCDPTKMHTPAKITVRDGYTGEPIKNAGISYECPPQKCIIGDTGDGAFRGNMPSCIGGTLSILHPDYPVQYVPLDTDVPVETIVELYPYTEVEFDAKKFLIKKSGNAFILDTDNAENLHIDEKAVVMLTKDDFSAAGQVLGDKFKTNELSRSIRIVPGKYEVRIVATTTPAQQWRILPKERCYDKGFFDEECVTIPKEAIVFGKGSVLDDDKPFPTGDHTLDWELKPEVLKGAKKITFRYISFELSPNDDNEIEYLELMSKPAELTLPNKERLEPEVSYD